MNYNKEKGKAFERKIANDLCKCFDLSFTRTPNSGAYVGGKNVVRMETLSDSQILLTEGDIIVPDELRNMKIECKARKSFSFNNLFTSNKDIDSWIEQATIGTENKVCFLIFKINNKGEYICYNEKYKNIFKMNENIMYYKDCIIQSYSGFFDTNKNILLDICK